MTQVESGKTLKEIRRQAVWGFTVSILGIFCFGLILEPFALYRGTKALRLIGESGLGTEYRTHARAAQVISVVMFFLWALLLAVAILGHGS